MFRSQEKSPAGKTGLLGAFHFLAPKLARRGISNGCPPEVLKLKDIWPVPYYHLQISKALEVGQKTNAGLLFDPLQLKPT